MFDDGGESGIQTPDLRIMMVSGFKKSYKNQ
jgi:hypothetical protein